MLTTSTPPREQLGDLRLGLRRDRARRRGQLDRDDELAAREPRRRAGCARRAAVFAAAAAARRRPARAGRRRRAAPRLVALVDRLAAQHAHRAEHRARVLRRRAAAAADQPHAALQHAPREHAEVLRVRDVERAALDRGGQAGVRLRDHRLAAADHVDRRPGTARRGRCRSCRRRRRRRRRSADRRSRRGRGRRRSWPCASNTIIAITGTRGPRSLATSIAVLHLEDRRERLEDDRVDAGEHERVDLLGEREPGEPALGGARDAELHAGRADGAGDVRAVAGRRARELDAGAVDRGRLLDEPVPRERDAVGAERVGLDQLGAGVRRSRGGRCGSARGCDRFSSS